MAILGQPLPPLNPLLPLTPPPLCWHDKPARVCVGVRLMCLSSRIHHGKFLPTDAHCYTHSARTSGHSACISHAACNTFECSMRSVQIIESNGSNCAKQLRLCKVLGWCHSPPKVPLPVMLHRVQYHYGSQRVTADERIYHRDGPPRLVQVMPHTPQPPQALLAEEHQALLAAERDCLQVCLKMHHRQSTDLLAHQGTVNRCAFM